MKYIKHNFAKIPLKLLKWHFKLKWFWNRMQGLNICEQVHTVLALIARSMSMSLTDALWYLYLNSVYKILPSPIVLWICIHNCQYLLTCSSCFTRFTFCFTCTCLLPQAVFMLIKSILPIIPILILLTFNLWNKKTTFKGYIQILRIPFILSKHHSSITFHHFCVSSPEEYDSVKHSHLKSMHS